MSDSSESESFDPMKSRLKEFQYYKMQQEAKVKEEQKKSPMRPDTSNRNFEKNKSAENSKNINGNNQAFNHEQGQDHHRDTPKEEKKVVDMKALLKGMSPKSRERTLKEIEEDFEK